MKKRDNATGCTESCGNVYADFGMAHAEELRAKAELAMGITDIIKYRRLSTKKAAVLMQTDPPDVLKIMKGLLSGFTFDSLFRFLTRLGYDLTIAAKRHQLKRTQPAIRVLPPYRTHRSILRAV